jgi:hypothetical protein
LPQRKNLDRINWTNIFTLNKNKNKTPLKMSKEEKDAYLNRVYFDTSELGSYSGLKRFGDALKRDGKYKVTKTELQQWLDNQDAYSLEKPIRYKFQRSRIVAAGIDDMWDIDLAEFRFQ